MDRSPRMPLAQPAFNDLEMPLCEVRPTEWVNLRFAEYAGKTKLFYPNPGARLTPFSMDVPCLYLARTEKTAFFELYGDRLYAAKQAGKRMIFPETELDRRVFVGVQTDLLRLCDLAQRGGGPKLHLDARTLWAADLEFPQRFAEAIYHHPANVDGIRYRSRHTDENCLVVWERRKVARPLKGAPSPLRAHLCATNIGHASLFGEEILLAGTSKTYDDLIRD